MITNLCSSQDHCPQPQQVCQIGHRFEPDGGQNTCAVRPPHVGWGKSQRTAFAVAAVAAHSSAREPCHTKRAARAKERSASGTSEHIVSRIRIIVFSSAAASIIICMMPGGGGVPGGTGPRDGFNYRIPPSWSPENDHQYAFRAYMTDIMLLVILTDLQPHQHCAVVVMRLGGSAREMARTMTPPRTAKSLGA